MNNKLFTLLLFALIAWSCFPLPTKFVEYDYFVDKSTELPYTSLYELDSISFLIQFPGFDPHESHWYEKDFVAYFYIDYKKKYSIRNLGLILKNGIKDIIPYRIYDHDSYKDPKVLNTSPRGIDFADTTRTLIGFCFKPEQINTINTAELIISFDILASNKTKHIENSYQVVRRKISKEIRDFHISNSRERLIMGPWWIDGKSGFKSDYDSLRVISKTNSEAAYLLLGRGFLPCIRYGKFHVEGFFMHICM